MRRPTLARRLWPRGGCDSVLCCQVDDRLFERRHQLPHADVRTTNVDQRIDHENARAVVGDLAATIDLHDLDVARREQVLARGIQPQGENRRVLTIADFICRGLVALVRERLHCFPARHVVLPTEPARFHKAIRTSSWAEASR